MLEFPFYIILPSTDSSVPVFLATVPNTTSPQDTQRLIVCASFDADHIPLSSWVFFVVVVSKIVCFLKAQPHVPSIEGTMISKKQLLNKNLLTGY